MYLRRMLSLTTNIIVLTCCSASSHNASPLSHTPVVARRCCCLLSSSSVSHIAPPCCRWTACNRAPPPTAPRARSTNTPAGGTPTRHASASDHLGPLPLLLWVHPNALLLLSLASFFNIMVGVSVVGWRGSLVPALPQRSTAITSSNSCCG